MEPTPKQVETILKVARRLAPQYTFGYYEVDDIVQEAYMIAVKAIKKFDSSKASFPHFIYIHLSKRLKNFRRDNYIRPFTCLSCKDASCSSCQRKKYRLGNKKVLMDNVMPNTDRSDNLQGENYLDDKETIIFLKENVSSEFRLDLLKVLDGKAIARHRKELLENHLKELLRGQAAAGSVVKGG